MSKKIHVTMSLEDIEHTINQLYLFGYELYGTNIFTKEAFTEVFMANRLGHKWGAKPGSPIIPDAYDKENGHVEYKTFEYTSNGYLKFARMNEDKIEKVKNLSSIYSAKKQGTKIIDIYKLNVNEVYDKLKELYKKNPNASLLTVNFSDLNTIELCEN